MLTKNNNNNNNNDKILYNNKKIATRKNNNDNKNTEGANFSVCILSLDRKKIKIRTNYHHSTQNVHVML